MRFCIINNLQLYLSNSGPPRDARSQNRLLAVLQDEGILSESGVPMRHASFRITAIFSRRYVPEDGASP